MKTLKVKLFSAIFAITTCLLLSFAVACGNGSDSTSSGGSDNEEDNIFTEIAKAWNDNNMSQSDFILYDEETGTKGVLSLGEYNGFVILFDNYTWEDDVDVSAVVSSITIGSYTFYYGYPFSLYAYKDGSFSNLKDIYEAGYLTDDDVAAIYAEYISYYPNIYTDSSGDSDNEEDDIFTEIAKAWSEQNPLGTFSWYDEETGTEGMIWLGEYNGYAVLFDNGRWGGMNVSDVISYIEIGKFTFGYGNPFHLYAYADGVFNNLKDVYNAGDISDSEITAIYWEYVKYLNVNYVDDEVSIEVDKDIFTEIAIAWNKQNMSFDHFILYDEDTGTKGVLYLGEYNGYVILFDNYTWEDDVAVSAVVSSITIGDYTFYYGYPFKLYAYKDGSFSNLNDIYEAGYLTDDDIAAIYAEYISYYPNIYTD